MIYSAQVPNALQTSVTGLKWFKIYQDGLSGGTWGVDRLIQNKGKVSFSIPSCIPAGQYLLRVELIGRFFSTVAGSSNFNTERMYYLALHGAGSYPGAQFYVSQKCLSVIQVQLS